MSTISCDACNSLRENASEFVQNGVVENVAASLMNDTGFNPALTVLHNNCEDLNNANDCLIGRMGDELEAYDVCDWKEYMGKYVPNTYEMLKAIIASDCGEWTRLHSLCSQLEVVKSLVTGGIPNPSWIPAAFTSTGLSQLTVGDGYDKSMWEIGLWVGQMDYVDCNGDESCSKIIRPEIVWRRPEVPGKGVPTYTMNNYTLGDAWGVWDKADLVPAVFKEEYWDRVKVGLPFNYSKTENFILGVRMLGYTVYNGVEYNAPFKSYGEDKMLLVVTSILGASGRVTGIGDTGGLGGMTVQIPC